MQSMSEQTLVITPTYRERDNIETLWQLLKENVPNVHLLIVDDGSDDGTLETVQRMMADDPRVSLLQRPSKLGLGTAYTLALSAAKEQGFGQVVQMDADGSHAPADVLRLVQQASEHEMVIGSRYIKDGRLSEDWPWHRRLLSSCANWLVSVVLGLGIKDATGGFRCTNGVFLKRLPLQVLQSRGYCWQWEYNRLVHLNGGDIHEEPICFEQRTKGESKMSMGIMLEGLWRLFCVRLSSRKTRVQKAIKTHSTGKKGVASPSRRQVVQSLGWLVLLGSLLTSMVAQPVWSEVEHDKTVGGTNSQLFEHVYIQRIHPQEPGAVVAVLHNQSDQPIRIQAVKLNGSRLRDWPGPSDIAGWYRLTTREIPPQGRIVLMVKLAQFVQGTLRIGIVTEQSTWEKVLSIDGPETVRIAAVRFAISGDRVNLFVENRGANTEQIDRVQIDNQVVWKSQTGLSLEPGAIDVVRMTLKSCLATGKRIQLTVHLKDRVLGTTIRPLPAFRIAIESGEESAVKRIGADPLVMETFRFSNESVNYGGLAAPSLQKREGAHWSMVKVSHGRRISQQQSDLACVFACPTHATDSYQTSAFLAMKAQREIERQQGWQSYIYCCRTQVLEGLSVFGSIGDGVQFNAGLPSGSISVPDDRDRVPWLVYGLTRYASEVAAPSAAFPMIMLEKDRHIFPLGTPLAIEVRQMVYAALAAGSGGISYRVVVKNTQDTMREQMLDTTVMVNDEIRQVRDLLIFGFPRSIAKITSSNHHYLQVGCLDAWPTGLLAVVINHQIERAPPEMPPSVVAVEQKDVPIEITLPDDTPIKHVWTVRGKERSEIESVQQSGRQLTVQLPVLHEGALLWIEPSKENMENS